MNKLKQIRLKLKITQLQACKLLNVSRRTYQKFEMAEDDNEKLQYLIYKLEKITTIDENHGILTLDRIKESVNSVMEKYDIKSCYLFGSYAKGKATESSDVDLAIDSDITGLIFYGLVEELREKLNKKIDLLTLNSLSENAGMLLEILKDGIKIYG